MKDTEIRGFVLSGFYERRRQQVFNPKPADFDIEISQEDLYAICDQLGEHGLIDWKPMRKHGQTLVGLGKISTLGIDVVERVEVSDLKINFVQNKTINISSSSNVIVGDGNQINISHHVHELAKAIDQSNAPEEQKHEARGLLAKFAGHPLVSAITGGLISNIGGQ